MSGPGDGGPESLVAHVAVDLPLSRLFTYVVPPALAAGLRPGHRVRAPFRGRLRVGVVVAVEAGAASDLSILDGVVDAVPALPGPLLELARWAANETASAWGQTIARALPPPLRTPRPCGAPDRSPSLPAGPGSVWLGVGSRRASLIEAAVGRALAAGESALLLAPEIETASRWADRLSCSRVEPVALVTSDVTPRRRWDAWWAGLDGRARVVVGTRVAAFWPLRHLGLLVVLDEDDPGHKAPDIPRWHARELALRRAGLEGARCLLASPVPSLESWARVRRGEARSLVAPDFTPDAGRPEVETWPRVFRVDLRQAGDDVAPLTPALREAVRDVLGRGEAVGLVLNRLGYGRALACGECGLFRRCAGCRLPLVYHRATRTLTCRFCGARVRAPSLCARCRGRRLRPVGWGTERLEAEARAAFGAAGVTRYDGTLSPRAAETARAAFRTGAARVLVGTHMALRLFTDRPVGLAALVLADATLGLPDFRAAERLVQLGWRMREGLAPGGVLWFQSYLPEHPAFEALATGQSEPFYEREWAERQELGYPPARRMARITIAGRDAARHAADLVARGRDEAWTLLGPVTVRHGLELIVLGDGALPGQVSRLVEPLRGRRLGAARLAVDVDPV